MKQLSVEAVALKDVRERDLYYLKISNGNQTHIINVGVKTYNQIKNLQKDDNDDHQTTITILPEEQLTTKDSTPFQQMGLDVTAGQSEIERKARTNKAK